MLTERHDRDGYTEILIWNEGDHPAYQSYRVICADFDFDYAAGGRRILPTVRISLLSASQPTPDAVRRLAAEYAEVADIAAALEAEKRAKFAEG